MSISRQWKKIKKEVERAVDAHDGFVAYMQIDFGRFGSPVSKQSPDCPGTPPCLHEMGGKNVAEAVGSSACRKPSVPDRTVGSLWSMRLRGDSDIIPEDMQDVPVHWF